MPSPPRVLVLDGRQRASLAVTRSLGKHGIPVLVADAGLPCLAGTSRFSMAQLDCPDAALAPERFVDWVAEACARHSIDMVFPITDITTMLLNGGILGAPRVCVICGPREPYELLSDKARLMQLATKMGVRIPHTAQLTARAQIDSYLSTARFPLVLKPARSRFLAGDRIVSTSVCLAATADEARRYLDAQDWLGQMPCLVQEMVEGVGAGVFSLHSAGRAIAWFAHQRIREKPPRGGVSVLCESVPANPQLRDCAQRLLAEAQWDGPAMVEFKVSPDGTPYLMEINARLWGSLQLAIDSGIDFPWLMLEITRGVRLKPIEGYVTGQRLRWFMGDLDNLLLELLGKGLAMGPAQKLAAFARFCAASLDFRARNEVLRSDDPAPALHELRNWVRDLI